MMRWAHLLCLGLVMVGAPGREAQAHAFDPNVLQLQETARGELWLTWTTSTPTDASRPTLPDRCLAEDIATAEPATTGRRTSVRWRVDCGEQDLAGAHIRFDGPATDTDTLVRLHRRDGSRWTMMVRAGEALVTLPAPDETDFFAVAVRYFTLGIEHIAFGIDHLLFVAALWLLVADRRSLLWTITAFTVGHSVTLGLATFNIITPRSAPVEVLIALSIVVLARQICIDESSASGHPFRQRTWTVALGFGLLHGFGFAGALRTLGVPREQILTALGAFNLGVELGQLTFVLLMSAGALVAEHSLRTVQPRNRKLVGYGLGAIATFWVAQRAIELGV